MSFRQKAGDGKGNVCNMVDIYCSATNRFLNLFIFGQATETIFSSSQTRAPELLTAKQVAMRTLDMCPYFDFHNMR